MVGDWSWRLELETRTGDWRLGLEIGDWRLGLETETGDWRLELRMRK